MKKLERAMRALEKATKLVAEAMQEQAEAERAGPKRNGVQPASGARGVVIDKRTGRYGARAWINKRSVWVGTYDTALEAKVAVEMAEQG